MLDKPVDSIVIENGKAVGVRCGEEIVRGKQVSFSFMLLRASKSCIDFSNYAPSGPAALKSLIEFKEL